LTLSTFFASLSLFSSSIVNKDLTLKAKAKAKPPRTITLSSGTVACRYPSTAETNERRQSWAYCTLLTYCC